MRIIIFDRTICGNNYSARFNLCIGQITLLSGWLIKNTNQNDSEFKTSDVWGLDFVKIESLKGLNQEKLVTEVTYLMS